MKGYFSANVSIIAQEYICDIHAISFIYAQLGEGCGVKETPQQKYQRLVNEIQELTQEVDAIQVSWRWILRVS